MHRGIKAGVAAAAAGAIGVGAVAMADGGHGGRDRVRLSGFEEVPALSTPGRGEFRASINRDSDEIRWRLSFRNLESAVTQAHIHFENETNNGPVIVFLCSNLAGAPAGTQACPAGGGTIRGKITADEVGGGGAAQGLAAGEIEELARAIRAGATYVNVHSEGRPSGEVRAQLGDDDHHRGHHEDD